MSANINAIVLCDLNEKIILCHVSKYLTSSIYQFIHYTNIYTLLQLLRKDQHSTWTN